MAQRKDRAVDSQAARDAITTRVEILELLPAKRRARLATTCTNQAAETVLEGEALCWIPEDAG